MQKCSKIIINEIQNNRSDVIFVNNIGRNINSMSVPVVRDHITIEINICSEYYDKYS